MKRTLAILLSVIMIISALPVMAFAAGTTISFETTFIEELVVGDTFTVVAKLAGNPTFGTMTLDLDWNEDVLSFQGFDANARGVLTSEVFNTAGGYAAPVINQEKGILTCADALGYDLNGVLFTANFEIVGSGELGLCFNEDKYEFKNLDGSADVDATIDYSTIANLSVAAPGPEGPTIPDGAPFTAISTDAGAAIAIDQQDDVNGVPYYIVTIPEDATTAYVTAPDQVVMEDWTTGELQATAYASDLSFSNAPLYISYNYEDTDDGPKVEIPMNMAVSDMSGGDEELDFINTHAFGIEDASYACLGWISFVYDDGAESYDIHIDDSIVGGRVWAENSDGGEITKAKQGDEVWLGYEENSGYQMKTIGYIYEGKSYHAENGVIIMPAGEITLTATFENLHTHVYDKEVDTDKYLKDAATCYSGAVYYKSCECGESAETAETAETFISGDPVNCVYEDGACKWCGEAEPVQTPGYTFATSADVSGNISENVTVHVKITGHSDENVTSYNAYDVTLTFDSDKLELATDENDNYIYSGAVKSDGGSVTVEGNTIRIVGCGAGKGFGTEIAALTFKTKAEGEATVTISKVQVSDKEESVRGDAPEATPKHDEDDTDADETPNVSVIVVPYTVTKPGFISGNDSILHGETYTFFYTDTTNYTYSGLTVTVGGDAVENLVADENGVYTIANVTGAIEITATQTPNSYDVTKPENVEGSDKATYGEDYIFTVTPSKEDMAIDTVKVTTKDGTEISYTINENGDYVIEGTDIIGAFTITVTEKEKMTTITFSGIKETEIEGDLTQTAEIGKDFTFKLIKEEGYDYTVKVGETELSESEETLGQYTVPAELVVKGGVQVDITKEDNTKPVVDVAEYINLDGKTMFLVTAKWGEKVLAYGENTMYYSSKYTVTGETARGAYCWLVVSTEELYNVDLVKDAAKAAIVEAAEGATATAIGYDYDVNNTTKVDVNDAQLVYDMYNASYMEFTDNLPMLKFLEADMSTDCKLDTKDVAAIINSIVNPTTETEETV